MVVDSLPIVCYSEFSDQQKEGGGGRGEGAERERGRGRRKFGLRL